MEASQNRGNLHVEHTALRALQLLGPEGGAGVTPLPVVLWRRQWRCS